MYVFITYPYAAETHFPTYNHCCFFTITAVGTASTTAVGTTGVASTTSGNPFTDPVDNPTSTTSLFQAHVGNSGDNNNSIIGIAAGVASGAVLLIVIIFVVVFLVLRKRKHNSHNAHLSEQMIMNHNSKNNGRYYALVSSLDSHVCCPQR